jgi:hypothetical protein
VNVGIKGIRHIVVYNVSDTFNVDSTSRDVGCDHHAERAVLESRERSRALALREVSVKRSRIDADLLKALTELLGSVLHLCEHNCKRARISREPRSEALKLVLVLYRVHRVRHGCHWGLRLYLHDLWVFEDLVRQLLNLIGHRCREEKRLALSRDLSNDLLNVRKESHIQHTVSFIEDESLNM